MKKFNLNSQVWVKVSRDRRRMGTIVDTAGQMFLIDFGGTDAWHYEHEINPDVNAPVETKKPLILNGKHPVMFDCDDTLIIWDEMSNSDQKFTEKGRVAIRDPNDGLITTHIVHKRHVGFLKKQKAKGYPIVVWSASGPEWASVVVTALGIEEYVDVVMGKPAKWVDDHSDPSEILANHIFLDIEGYSL